MLRSRTGAVCLALLLAALPGVVLAQSQATTGVIEGTVSDEAGAPLPGASVALRNTATNFEKTTTTGSDGRFRGLALPLGPYRVTVSLAGFSTLVREGLDLGVGQTINLGLTLRLSQRAESVTVTGAAPVVETTRTENSVQIDSASIQGLPNNGRNFLEFTKLTPGVSVVQGPDGDELTVNGQKGIQNNVSVDGADFNNPFFGEQRGGQRPPFTFNLDAVKEVVVVSDGANAEFGRASAGFVNVVTKSGTNDLHGSVHGFYKNDGLSSAPVNPDGSSADKFDQSQLQAGLTLGGPFVKDKLFFFTAFDYQRGRSTKQTNPNRIDPRLVEYFASVGAPNENGPIERTNDARVFLGKIDWAVNERHLATVRYTYTWSEQKNGTFDVDPWARSSNGIEKDSSNAGSGSLQSTFTNSLLNEFRFQWAREDRPRPYEGPQVPGGGRPFPDTGVGFGLGYRFGQPFFLPIEYHDTRLQLNENVTLLSGNHTIKAGVEYNRTNSGQTFIGFANGRILFDSVDGFLAFTKDPTQTQHVVYYSQHVPGPGLTINEAGTQNIVQEEPAVFIQDKWQPLPNLTISLGLRWEAQIQPDPITPPDKVFFSKFIGTTSKGQEFPSDGTIPSDKTMWQPRFGIVWDPNKDGKTVVRANGGIFAARIPGLNLASTRSTNGSLGYDVSGPVPAYPNIIPISSLPTTPDHPGVFVFSKDFKNPRTYAASVAVEREVVPDIAVSLKYNYAHTVNIGRFINRNDPLLGGPWSTGLGADGKNGLASLSFTGLTTFESTGHSVYNGITLGLVKRYTNNFEFQAFYTLSWDKSDDDNERDPFTFSYAKVTDLGPEYGYSDRDQRHRVNAYVLWRAPFEINVNGSWQYRSAQPQSITSTGAFAGSPQDRINPDGSITERNLGRKDNQFNSFNLRISRGFVAGAATIEPVVEVFNLFNSKNLRRPGSRELLFNFDGTVQSGLGDPRQVQLGVRVLW
ncbi:MAG TPA: carboxypeptidase regulatory-like domain-containing protein [Thermoanaerobaculia bacterium]|nr:carboxypeptidase regulatory-like domain-containing protein [Thermoanaerobaculia bacterium]